MEDIAPKLYEKIKKEFDRKISDSKRLSTLSEKLAKGIVTYREAHEFAIESGKILSQTFQNNLSSSVLPNGKLYYNIADRILRPMMGELYEGVADYSKEVQTVMNKQQNIGIKVIKSELNEDKVQGIIDITSGKEHFDDVEYMLGEPLINFAQTIVDDTVRVNADFQYKSGLRPKIIRTSTGKCCKWCDNLAGVYDYEDVSDTGNDVFRRHKHCRCLVEYDVGDRKRTNVHTKKTAEKEDIEKRIENANKSERRTTKSREHYVEKAKNISRDNLDRMSLRELRRVAIEVGTKYYQKGLSGISFGERDPEEVVKKLVAQGNRTSLKKDIISMREKLRNSKKDDTMKLPKYEEVIIPKEKFTQYALNREKDPDKAKAFERALGYTVHDADELIEQITKKIPNYTAVEKGDRGYGMTYEVIMDIRGKNGKTAKVLTAWIDDKNNGEMRLTTVHVDD